MSTRSSKRIAESAPQGAKRLRTKEASRTQNVRTFFETNAGGETCKLVEIALAKKGHEVKNVVVRRVRDRVFVEEGSDSALGLKPGYEVVKVNGKPSAEWTTEEFERQLMKVCTVTLRCSLFRFQYEVQAADAWVKMLDEITFHVREYLQCPISLHMFQGKVVYFGSSLFDKVMLEKHHERQDFHRKTDPTTRQVVSTPPVRATAVELALQHVRLLADLRPRIFLHHNWCPHAVFARCREYEFHLQRIVRYLWTCSLTGELLSVSKKRSHGAVIYQDGYFYNFDALRKYRLRHGQHAKPGASVHATRKFCPLMYHTAPKAKAPKWVRFWWKRPRVWPHPSCVFALSKLVHRSVRRRVRLHGERQRVAQRNWLSLGALHCFQAVCRGALAREVMIRGAVVAKIQAVLRGVLERHRLARCNMYPLRKRQHYMDVKRPLLFDCGDLSNLSLDCYAHTAVEIEYCPQRQSHLSPVMSCAYEAAVRRWRKYVCNRVFKDMGVIDDCRGVVIVELRNLMQHLLNPPHGGGLFACANDHLYLTFADDDNFCTYVFCKVEDEHNRRKCTALDFQRRLQECMSHSSDSD